MPYNWGPNSENHWDSDETYIPPQQPKKIKPKIVKVKIDLADPALWRCAQAQNILNHVRA